MSNYTRVQGFEGFRPKPYEDRGYMSVGYGTRAQPGDENGITQEEASKRMASHYDQSTDTLYKKYPWMSDAPEGVRTAMEDFTYNVGDSAIKGFPKMEAALKAGDYATASKELLDSEYAKQVGGRAISNAELLAQAATAEGPKSEYADIAATNFALANVLKPFMEADKGSTNTVAGLGNPAIKQSAPVNVNPLDIGFSSRLNPKMPTITMPDGRPFTGLGKF